MAEPCSQSRQLFGRRRLLGGYVAPLCVLCGLSCALFYQAAAMAPLQTDNAYTFHSFQGGIDGYREFKNVWKPRLFANALAAEVVPVCYTVWGHSRVPGVRGAEQFTVGVWTAGWFIVIGVLYIMAAKERSLFYLLGTYAGICFGYTPGLALRIFPWDMPILLIYTVFVLLFVHRRYRWLVALLAVGMGFKETAGVLCLAFLFTQQPWRQRLNLFFSAVVLCAAAKAAIDLYAHAGIPLFTMETEHEFGSRIGTSYLVDNLVTLSRGRVLLVNGGMLLAFLLLPAPDRPARAMKAIAAVFLAALLLFGLIHEFRIFFEMIPLALYSLAITVFRSNPLRPPEADG